MTPAPLLRLAVKCDCGRTPPIRISEYLRELAREVPDHIVMANWRCDCGRLIDLTAQAYARAA